MPSPARFLIAAAAVVAAAVVGLTVLRPAQSTGPGGLATPGASASEPSPAATAPESGSAGVSAVPPVYRWPASLAAGTYTTSFAWDAGLQFTFTVPAGWDALDINIAKNDRVSLAFYPIEDVAPATCASPAPSGPGAWTSDTVLAELDKLVAFDAAPVPVSAAGRAARYVAFTARAPIGCPANGNVIFRTPTPTCPPTVCSGVGPPSFGLEFGNVTHHERLWLMDVGRRVVAMNALWTDAATPTELAELQSVVDSAQLATPLATPGPQPAPSGP